MRGTPACEQGLKLQETTQEGWGGTRCGVGQGVVSFLGPLLPQ